MNGIRGKRNHTLLGASGRERERSSSILSILSILCILLRKLRCLSVSPCLRGESSPCFSCFVSGALLLVVFLVSVLLGGCARAGIRWGSTVEAADGRVHISYWEKWTDFEGDAMRAVVNTFNRSQNRIFVDLLTVSQVEQKMLLATAGGNPPDVAGLYAYNVNVYADKNALLPQDDYCRRDGIGGQACL